jgi:hypothetical protein
MKLSCGHESNMRCVDSVFWRNWAKNMDLPFEKLYWCEWCHDVFEETGEE